MQRKLILIGLAALLAVGVCSGIASADVIWNTFAAGDTFPISSGTGIDPEQILACQFAVSGNDYLFDQLEFAAAVYYGAESIAASLRADSAGIPGSTIESLPLVTGVPQYAGKLSVNSVTRPLLQNGSTYWIVLAPGTSGTYGFWPQNNGLPAVAAAYSTDWSSWIPEVRNTNVFRVHGTVVPEPSGLLWMCAGLGSLGGVVRRLRK